MKKLLLGLGTIAAVTAPVVSVVACSFEGDSKYVETQEEAMDILTGSVKRAVPFSQTHFTYRVWLSKIREEHNGFRVEVDFTNIKGATYSEKLKEYEYDATHIWSKLKKNLLNPFVIEITSSDGVISERCVGYAHGYEMLDGGTPSHKDGQLFIV